MPNGRELRRNAGDLGEVIEGDRLCPGCQYNLKGLRRGGVCPECGRPIAGASRARRFTDTLTDAPLPYLHWLCAGLWVMAISGGVGAVCGVWSWSSPARPEMVAMITAVVAAAWAAGVWIVTGPRGLAEHSRPDAILDSVRLAWIIRLTQMSWVLWALLLLAALRLWAMANAAAATPGAGPPKILLDAVMAGLVVTTAAGVVGLIPLSLRLHALAQWAGDDGMADRFRGAAWVLAIACAMVLLLRVRPVVSSVVAGVITWMGVASLIAAVVALAVFLGALLQLAYDAAWAINNHAEAQRVAERLAARQRAHEAKLVEGLAPPASPRASEFAHVPPPAPSACGRDGPAATSAPPRATGSGADRPPPTMPARGGSGYYASGRDRVIEPPLGEAGADPYELADEGDGTTPRGNDGRAGT